MEVRRRWGSAASFVLLAALAIMAAAYSVRIFQLARQNEDRLDFSHYYTSSYLLRKGVDPYAVDLAPVAIQLGFEAPDMTYATNPPPLVLLFEPFTLFSPHVAYWIWFGFNVFLLVVFFELASTEFQAAGRVFWSLTCLSLMYPPVVVHFQFAQAQILILVLLALALRFLHHRRDSAAGAALAVATLIKIFPVIIAGYLIARRKWKALGYMILWGAFGAVLSLWGVGVHGWIKFVQESAKITSLHWLLEAGNISINGTILRCVRFAVGEGASRNLLFIVHPLIILLEMGAFALTLTITSGPKSSEAAEAAGFGLWMAAATVLAPTSWVHYLVLLLLPLWQIGVSVTEGRASRGTLWAAASSYFLTYTTALGIEEISTTTPIAIAEFTLSQVRFAAPALVCVALYLLMRDLAATEANAPLC